MKVYDEQTVKEVYHMHHAINDIEAILNNLDDVSQVSRQVIPTGEGAQPMLYMPAIHYSKQMGMIKITSITPSNPQHHRPTTQANLIMTNIETGEHVASIDGSYLTRLRTGALSGIATKYLSRKDATTLGLIGTGGMAYEQLLGNLEVRAIKHVILYNRTTEKAQQFQKFLNEHHPDLEVSVVPDVTELVKQSDIINCQTQSATPVFDAKDVQKGTHINGIGSYRPDMQEIDYHLLPQAQTVIFDDLEGVKEEAGEFINADKEGIFKFEEVNGTLQSLVEAKDVERSNEDITVFKSVGASYYDLAVAIGAYDRLK